jgi:hypothetical protein
LYEIKQEFAKLAPMEDAEMHPLMADLMPDMDRCTAMITDAKGLRASCVKGLGKLKELYTKADQEAASWRKQIADHLAELFPAIKEDLIKIEAGKPHSKTRKRE